MLSKAQEFRTKKGRRLKVVRVVLICRPTRAIAICKLCQDHGTRLIAIDDRFDTADEGWRDGAFRST